MARISFSTSQTDPPRQKYAHKLFKETAAKTKNRRQLPRLTVLLQLG